MGVFNGQLCRLGTVPKQQLVANITGRQSAHGQHRDPENPEKIHKISVYTGMSNRNNCNALRHVP